MKKLLVALDESSSAKNVLTGARELAEKTQAKLLLFHAVSLPVGLPTEAYAMSPTAVGDLVVGTAKKMLTQHASDLPESLVAGVRVEIGTPWRAICEAAKAEQVDLIAIGSHGYGGIDRLLGTTAAKVVNHADRSVLVIRAIELLDELIR